MGGKLPDCEGARMVFLFFHLTWLGFVKKYYKISENDLHDETQGSHWYLGVKVRRLYFASLTCEAIKWKCVGEPEQIINEANFSYKEKWKNTKPDKTFLGR